MSKHALQLVLCSSTELTRVLTTPSTHAELRLRVHKKRLTRTVIGTLYMFRVDGNVGDSALRAFLNLADHKDTEHTQLCRVREFGHCCEAFAREG
ncbi:hypothetical protein RSAG8_12273, partial [Rhizoctonia solani AG-8 WAC10335]